MNTSNMLTRRRVKKYHSPIFLFVTVLLTLFYAVLSCNDEDDVLPAYQVPAEDVFSSELDSIQVDFALFNIRGEQTTSFAYGEDIIFDLKVYNNSNTPLIVGLQRYFLGEDMFRVYTSRGQNVGTSWHYKEIDILTNAGIAAHSMKHWQCPWLSSSEIKPSYPFVLNEKNRTLSKGSYYVVAPVHIHIDDITIVTCVIHFEIY